MVGQERVGEWAEVTGETEAGPQTRLMMSPWVPSQQNGGGGAPQPGPPLAAASPPDPDALTYTVQHQVLGSDQWTALVTGLRQPGWAATGLRKGVQHIFRVLSTTIKSSSKPSPPSEPVQLLERGESGVPGGGRREPSGQGTVSAEEAPGLVWMQ